MCLQVYLCINEKIIFIIELNTFLFYSTRVDENIVLITN